MRLQNATRGDTTVSSRTSRESETPLFLLGWEVEENRRKVVDVVVTTANAWSRALESSKVERGRMEGGERNALGEWPRVVGLEAR